MVLRVVIVECREVVSEYVVLVGCGCALEGERRWEGRRVERGGDALGEDRDERLSGAVSEFRSYLLSRVQLAGKREGGGRGREASFEGSLVQLCGPCQGSSELQPNELELSLLPSNRQASSVERHMIRSKGRPEAFELNVQEVLGGSFPGSSAKTVKAHALTGGFERVDKGSSSWDSRRNRSFLCVISQSTDNHRLELVVVFVFELYCT
jgi:hypothetical protein